MNDEKKIVFHYFTPLVCNARCQFCSSSSSYHSKNYIIPRTKITGDLLKIKKLWFNSVVIGGWEPTLIENLIDYVYIGKKLGIKISIITNGALLNVKYVQELFHAGLENICFSVHSTSATLHDSLVQIPWAHKNIMQLLANKTHQSRFSTNTVIIKQNQNQLLDIVHLLSKFWIKIWFCNMEANHVHISDYEKKRMYFPDLLTIRREIHKIYEAYPDQFLTFDNLPLCAFDEHIVLNKNFLIANYQRKQIDPNIVSYFTKKVNQLTYKIKSLTCNQCRFVDNCAGHFPYFKEEHLKPFC